MPCSSNSGALRSSRLTESVPSWRESCRSIDSRDSRGSATRSPRSRKSASSFSKTPKGNDSSKRVLGWSRFSSGENDRAKESHGRRSRSRSSIRACRWGRAAPRRSASVPVTVASPSAPSSEALAASAFPVAFIDNRSAVPAGTASPTTSRNRSSELAWTRTSRFTSCSCSGFPRTPLTSPVIPRAVQVTLSGYGPVPRTSPARTPGGPPPPPPFRAPSSAGRSRPSPGRAGRLPGPAESPQGHLAATAGAGPATQSGPPTAGPGQFPSGRSRPGPA